MSENPQEQTEAKLLAYIEGELDDAGRAEIERHLLANPKHRRLLADLAVGRDLVRRLPREPAPAELFDGFQSQLERQLLLSSAADVNPETGNFRLNRWGQIRAAAAAVVLAAGLGVIVYSVLPKNTQTAVRTDPAADPKPATGEGTDVAKSVTGVPAGATPGEPDLTAVARGPDVLAPIAGPGGNIIEKSAAANGQNANAIPDAQKQMRSREAEALDALRRTELADAARAAWADPEVRRAVAGEPDRPYAARKAADPAPDGGTGAAGGTGRELQLQPAGKRQEADAGPFLLVVASADPTAAQARIDAALSDIGGAKDDRQSFARAADAQAGRRAVAPTASPAPVPSGVDAAARPDLQPSAAGDQGNRDKTDNGVPSRAGPATPGGLAAGTPAPTPAPAPSPVPGPAPIARPAAQPAQPAQPARPTIAAAPGTAPSALAATPEGAGTHLSERMTSDRRLDRDAVVIVRRVPRARVHELALQLNRPEARQFAAAYPSAQFGAPAAAGGWTREQPGRANATPANAAAATTAPATARTLGDDRRMAVRPQAAGVDGARAGGPPAGRDTGVAPAAPKPGAGGGGAASKAKGAEDERPLPDPAASDPTAAARPITRQAVAGGAPARSPAGPAPTAAPVPPAAAPGAPAAAAPAPAVPAPVAVPPQARAADAERPIRPGDTVVLSYAVRATPGAPVPTVTVSAAGTIQVARYRNFEPFPVAGMTPRAVADQVNEEFRRQGEQRTVEVRYPTAAEMARLGRGAFGGPAAYPQAAAPPAPAPVAPAQPHNPRADVGGAAGGGAVEAGVADPGTDLVDVVIVLRRTEAAADKVQGTADTVPETKPAQP